MRKMDEMEMEISLKVVKWAWFYTVVFLFIWTTYDFIKVGSFSDSPAFILLISQNLIRLFIEQYLKQKVSRNEK